MERRLAAILAADVVGYSRLMGEDEAGTLERLKSLSKELMQPGIEFAHYNTIEEVDEFVACLERMLDDR